MVKINKLNAEGKVEAPPMPPKGTIELANPDWRNSTLLTGFEGKTKTNIWPLVITAIISIAVSLIAVYAYLAK